jgi:D-alanyl-D-alanine carboxypeptidase/D-alanyl-D-alanine-endopeptidase (penicillin-binding protein 4)
MATRGALAIAVALAFTPADAAAASAGRLRKGIEKVLARPAFAPAWWGIEVRGLASGKVLYSRNAARNVKPASTLKLVTTAAVLDAFGPDARLRTSVETAGRLDGLGRILGDVYLVGRGDPTLGRRPDGGRPTATFEELVDALRAAGIRRVEGRLVGWEGLFAGERRGADWTWEDLVWSYGAEISALSFNGNSGDLLIGPGERPGDPLVVDRSPASSYFHVVSTATTSAAGSEARLTLFRAPGGNLVRLSGTLPAGRPAETRSVALEDPARYAASVFGEVLEKGGIGVAGPVETSSEPLPADLRVLAFHDSEPLAEMLRTVNKESRNLDAEMLLRQLGARVNGEGSAEAGLAAVRAFLARAGVRSDAWSLQDGSGLSRSDTVSAAGLVELLAAMDKHRHALAFRESLAVAGVDGTLEDRMKGTPAQGRILAKTGSLRHVNALAGYAFPRSGERLAFAVVVNHHSLPGREAAAAIDAICALLVE